MANVCILLAIFATIALSVNAAFNDSAILKGVDVSQPLDANTASCLINQGYGSIAIARAFKSGGSVDTNFCGTISNAVSAGYQNVAVYLFPCTKCGPAADQVNTLVSALNGCSAAQGSLFKIWLDVEGTQYWLGDYSKNQQWYKDLVDACKSTNYKCGVYSSANNWQTLFGTTSFVYGNDLPMWYAHYDNDPSFDDYPKYSYGGWTQPWAKQYAGDANVCSFGVDLNYVPYASNVDPI